MSNLTKKLKELPNQPGVYFHKSKTGEIIYVGKAAILKNRVRQYFQNSRDLDTKTRALVAEIADTEWITVESEIDALFLESEMIKRYKPRYNILLRDDKSQIFVRLNMRDVYPYLSFTRSPLDDDAEYFGPYYNGWAVKKALRYLRHIFPYSTHEHMPRRVCLQYHLGLCPGVEEQKISSADYKKTLRKLTMYLSGERKKLIQQLESEMKTAAKTHDYETAAARRNQIHDLRELQKQIVFGDREFMDISKDKALAGLQELLGLPDVPQRIEGYDISHMSGTNNVASMVVATNGMADKAQYRKFKMQIPGNNDFAHMHEVISRRFSGRHDDWPTPSLLLIDGGKGQLGAALKALHELGVAIPAVGLAKRLEEIVVPKEWAISRGGAVPGQVAGDAEGRAPSEPNASERDGKVALSGGTRDATVAEMKERTLDAPYITESDDFYVVLLPKSSHIVKLLQRVRDESHRFAVSYHTHLKRQRQTASELDEIPGIGPVTRKKLIQTFGSLRGVKAASPEKLQATVGKSKAAILVQYLAPRKR